ncbi:MAG: ABC transporter permease [Spirochaetales bacterium]|nr:MAG: ABC transporter permease [Spirochaetales bacterium]
MSKTVRLIDNRHLTGIILPRMVRLAGFLGRRVGRLILTVLIITTLVFFLVRVLPGDPASVIAGVDADPADVAAIRNRLGMDRPVAIQYLEWLWGALRLDFGESFFSGQPAMSLVLERFPLTLSLAVMAFGLSLVIAIPLGVVSAVHKWRAVDYVGMVYSQLGMAIPGFWLGILLLLLFAVRLGWFPLFGADSFAHLVLPAVALGVGRSALLTRYVRSSMIEELGKEYILTAESLGLSRRSIYYRHALINALVPVITVAGIQFGSLLGGTIIIEQVFSMPGVGRVLLSAIQQRDFAVIQAGVVFIAVIFSSANFLADILYSVANPRIRVA